MLSQAQGHSAAGRIMSMKNSSDNIGNGTRDLPACSAVPQPTAPPRIPVSLYMAYKIQTPRNYPEKSIKHSEHSESLNPRIYS
jgi:hypothetical protein